MSDLINTVIDKSGNVQPTALADFFHTSLKELSSLSGVSKATLGRKDRYLSDKTQIKLREVCELLNRILPWAGNTYRAYAWYRSEAIPELGGLTAEELVKSGQGDLVRAYLRHTSMGGYA